MNKKKIGICVAAVLLAAAIGGGIFLIPWQSREPVPVYSAGMLTYTASNTGSGESYGVVAADRVQSVYVSDTQNVTRIYVYQGQQVKKGDLLYTFDTTLSKLTLERKDLSIQQMEMNLKNAQAELKQLNAMKPMVVTTTPGTNTNTQFDKSPSSKGKLNTIYGGLGTSGNPYRFWISQDMPLHEELIWEIIDHSNSNVVYVVFQLTKSDKTNTEYDAQYGVRFEVLELEEEPPATDPTDPSGGETPPESSEPTDPTEGTEEGSGGSSGEFIPRNSREREAGEETVQSARTEAQPESRSQQPVAAAARQTRRVYVMTFFDPEKDVKEESTQIDWNSGYTQAELVTMRKQKSEEIDQLKFNIKMGKAELAIMKKEASDGNVYAEFDGVVVSVLEPGNARKLNQPMLKLTGGGGYYVEGSVSEMALDTIAPGLTVSVNCWENGTIYTGTVTEVGIYPSEGEQFSGAANVTYYPFKVFVDENADLQEGAFVSLTYQTGGSDDQVMYLENAFIRYEGKESYVYVRNGEGLLEKRVIRTGISTDGYATPVYSGLSEEDFLAFPYGRSVREGAGTVEAGIETLYGG